MDERLSDIIAGRKTFFFVPDVTLFPENFLEEYLSKGYETYFIKNDKACSLERKIDVIVRVFKDSILFFNIDYSLPDVNWPLFIRKIQLKYRSVSLIGILYTKRQTDEEQRQLEKYYLYDLELQAGCIQLEYRKQENFSIVEKILYANQASGRRKYVRAICTSNCSFTFMWKKLPRRGSIRDISLSHFSCILPEGAVDIPLYEKIQGIQLNIKGLHLTTDAVLNIIRPSEAGTIYIFTFTNGAGKNGLDILSRQLLVPRLYEIMAENCALILNRLFYRQKSADENTDEISEK